MTGEIDLYGHVHAIGGLQAKIEGAIRAGAKIVLIPKENGDEWDELIEEYQNKINVVKIESISQVLCICLVNREHLEFNMHGNPFEDKQVQQIMPLIKKFDAEFDIES